MIGMWLMYERTSIIVIESSVSELLPLTETELSAAIGNQIFGVRHCPGHTPGHVIFFHEETKLAAVGDVLFQGSIGRSDLPRGNHQQLVDSIVNELWPLGAVSYTHLTLPTNREV